MTKGEANQSVHEY